MGSPALKRQSRRTRGFIGLGSMSICRLNKGSQEPPSVEKPARCELPPRAPGYGYSCPRRGQESAHTTPSEARSGPSAARKSPAFCGAAALALDLCRRRRTGCSGYRCRDRWSRRRTRRGRRDEQDCGDELQRAARNSEDEGALATRVSALGRPPGPAGTDDTPRA